MYRSVNICKKKNFFKEYELLDGRGAGRSVTNHLSRLNNKSWLAHIKTDLNPHRKLQLCNSFNRSFYVDLFMIS